MSNIAMKFMVNDKVVLTRMASPRLLPRSGDFVRVRIEREPYTTTNERLFLIKEIEWVYKLNGSVEEVRLHSAEGKL